MPTDNDPTLPSHFKGKEAINHVAEAQAQGTISSAEIHGTEIPGPLSAGADAARDTAFLLLILALLLARFTTPYQSLSLLMFFFVGFLAFRTGRSAWLGWFRLERLHRVLDQERFEIEHHRDQERDELKELYRAKGFEGKLLEDVIDVLMADGDRLLKVMVQEELGLSLENVEHPLKQGLGAFVGVFLAGAICIASTYFFDDLGLLVASLFVIAVSAGITAAFARNKLIPAIVWNCAFCLLAYGLILFLLRSIP